MCTIRTLCNFSRCHRISSLSHQFALFQCLSCFTSQCQKNHWISVIAIFSLNILTPLLSITTLFFKWSFCLDFLKQNCIFPYASQIFIQVSECKNNKWGIYYQAMLRRTQDWVLWPLIPVWEGNPQQYFDYTFLNKSHFFKYLILILKMKYIVKLIIKLKDLL